MKSRRIQIGLDYGTSTSKIVVRDYGAPGGEVAHVFEMDGRNRFDSAAALKGDYIHLGCSQKDLTTGRTADRIYPSLKMRVAGEVTGDYTKYCHTELEDLPVGVSASDIATLTVAHLLSKTVKSVRRQIRGNLSIGMTMGIPMSFFDSEPLRNAFLKIARGAFFLWKDHGFDKSKVRIRDARQLLENVRSKAEMSVPKEQLRDWIRSEAEAAMLWGFLSPAVAAGPFANVDLGAGTTNASCFRIGDEIKDGARLLKSIAFFGASSTPNGMDAIDAKLAEYKKMPLEQAISLRGKEAGILEDIPTRNYCGDVVRDIHGTLKLSFGQWFEKCRGATDEIADWDNNCRIFLVGGGSLVKGLHGGLTVYPRLRDRRIPPLKLEAPSDLTYRGKYKIPADILRFSLVSYGLSHLGMVIPEAKTPCEIPPMTVQERTRKFLDHEEKYAK